MPYAAARLQARVAAITAARIGLRAQVVDARRPGRYGSATGSALARARRRPPGHRRRAPRARAGRADRDRHPRERRVVLWWLVGRRHPTQAFEARHGNTRKSRSKFAGSEQSTEQSSSSAPANRVGPVQALVRGTSPQCEAYTRRSPPPRARLVEAQEDVVGVSAAASRFALEVTPATRSDDRHRPRTRERREGVATARANLHRQGDTPSVRTFAAPAVIGIVNVTPELSEAGALDPARPRQLLAGW